MSKSDGFRDLFGYLDAENHLEYGAVFPRSVVWDFLDLEVPEMATMKEFTQIQLQELAAIDYIRGCLLDEGKYLKADGDNYRILLPSENAQQIVRYMDSADKKLNRALKLSRNTPKEADASACQVEARILMRREGARQRLAA